MLKRRLPAPGRPLQSLLAAISVLLAAALLAGCGSSSDAPDYNGETRFKLPDAPGVKLPAWGPDVSGRTLPLRPAQGRLLLLFFGYTSCPDVCPTTMSAFGAAARLLPPELRDQVEGGMVTVDPARDSGPGLRKYVAHFFNAKRAWAWRPADKKQQRKAERAFGVASEIDPHKRGESYTVTHTTQRYAVDAAGNILLMWNFNATSEQIAEDIKKLLARDDLPPAAGGAVAVSDPWMRTTAADQSVGVLYLTLKSARDDELTGVSVPKDFADAAQLHVSTIDENGRMGMQPTAALKLPAGKQVKLSPGGTHVMLMGLKGPIKRGQKVPVTLHFKQAPDQRTTATARD